MDKKKLTPKQALFVQHYLSTLCATQAAILSGYSKRSAGSIGEENLKKPEIRAAIEVVRQRIEEKLTVDRDRVLAEIGKLALSDERDFIKLNALKLLGDHYGLFKPRQNDADDGADQIALDERLSEIMSKSQPQ